MLPNSQVYPELTLEGSSLGEITYRLTNEFPSLSGKTYTSLCDPISSNVTCFISTHTKSPHLSTLSLTFAPGSREDWTSALKREASFTPEDTEIKYEIQSVKREETIGEMKSSKWIAYALRALVLRFWDLGKVSHSYFEVL